MKLLITGATGFIGKRLLQRLAPQASELRLLVRNPALAGFPRLDSIKVYPGSLEDTQSTAKAVNGVDTIIHLAGLVKARQKQDFYRINAIGTRQLIQTACHAPQAPQHFIYVSSLAAVGPNCNDLPLSEDFPTNPISHYGRSKLLGEQAVLEFAQRMQVTILRPPIVYGPGDHEMLIFFQMARRGWVPLVSALQMKLSVIHVDDLVSGIWQVLQARHIPESVYFLANPDPVTVGQLLRCIGQAVRKHPRTIPIPKTLAWPLACMSDVCALLLRQTPMFSRDKLKELTASSWVCSAQRAMRDFAFAPVIPLQQGISQTAEWYREQGQIQYSITRP